MVSLPKRLKQLRVERQWTQRMLAKKAGLSLAYITKSEAGWYDPQLSTLRKLAKALGVTISGLVEHTKEKP